MRKRVLIASLIVCAAVAAGPAQEAGHFPVSMVDDWSSRHVIFTEAVPRDLRGQILMEPRFWHQYYRRHMNRPMPSLERDWEHERGRDRDRDRDDDWGRRPRRAASHRDWSISLGGGHGGTISGPAKFVFDVTAAPSCTTDFVVTGVQVAGSGTQANIIGLNNLYSNPAGTGFCAGTGPNVIFAYNVGTGTINSFITMSLSGQKLAFNENLASGFFHVLTYKTGTGNGTSATAPAAPGTGNSAVDVKLPLGAAVTTAPYVDYQRDVAYVTTSNSVVHKFSGVFNGTPAEVTTGGWPMTVTGNPGISSPIFDPITRHIFFMTGTGFIDYVNDSVIPATLVATFSFAANGITAAPLIVDSTRQKVYAFAGSNGTNAIAVQADTNLTAASKVTTPIGNSSTNVVLEGDFNNAYYTGAAFGTAFLYAVGNDRTATIRPALYNIGFDVNFKMSATAANGPTALSAGTTTGVTASPITEFFNSNLAKDFLFVGVTGACTATGGSGCVRSLDITGGFPGAINTVILNATGGTGVITVDNNNTSRAEASSVYYTPLGSNVIVKATQATLQ